MKAMVLGSLNIDHVYQVDHFVQAGETLDSYQYSKNAGGKGLNQSIALAKAGQEILFAGAIGKDGLFLKEFLNENGVDTLLLQVLDAPTGHAIIQINGHGENSILLYGGANQQITRDMIASFLSALQPGDLLLIQNEVSLGDEIICQAKARGVKLALNPSPCTPELFSWPLEQVDWIILNEIEGEQLSGKNTPDEMVDVLLARCPETCFVLTLGEDGVMYADKHTRCFEPAVSVDPVDTTAAGDTFTGYFLHAIMEGKPEEYALREAAQAAAIAVTRPGAAKSIPTLNEVRKTER